MTDYLLDTNVLIYLMKKDGLTIKKLRALKASIYSISAVSYFEFLMGVSEEEHEEAECYLERFRVIPLNTEIAKEAVHFARSVKKKLKFKDLIIAATAKQDKQTLLTADRDFKHLKGIDVEYMKR